MYKTIRKLAEDIRKKPRPVLVECLTFRMRGHEEASGTKYVPKELMDAWAEKDPLKNYEQYLLEKKVITADEISKLRSEITEEIQSGLDLAFAEPAVEFSLEKEIGDVYAPYVPTKARPATLAIPEKRFVDAISDGMRQAMEKYPNLVLMGQDIAEYGGAFKITEGFVEQFGKERVRNTPLCESAIIGIGLGLSMAGYKSMVEMQFADFVACGFNQIINNLAKLHYRWGENADVVIRMPCGGGVGAGPFHSQSNEAWFFHTPGLKVVYPSNPYDAKGLLLAAFEDPNPVLYFEHKALYRSLTDKVPDDYYTIEIGKAARIREGSDVTIISYGAGVKWALEVVDNESINCDLIDLRTLLPLDYDTIAASVKKTNKVIILQEDTLTGGIASELSAWISEHLFEYLDAPVIRAASLDTPVPFAKNLEEGFLPKNRFKTALDRLITY